METGVGMVEWFVLFFVLCWRTCGVVFRCSASWPWERDVLVKYAAWTWGKPEHLRRLVRNCGGLDCEYAVD